MIDFVLDNGFSIFLLVMQCGLTIATGYISIYQLRKEFGKRSDIDKSEARHVRFGLIALFSLTVLLQVATFCDNKASERFLQHNFDTLKNGNTILKDKNDRLEKAEINEVDSNTAKVVFQASTNAIAASNTISNAANKLSLIIKGTDSIPALNIEPGNKFVVVYTNKSSLPIFNMDLKLENYDSLKQCRIDYYAKSYHINQQCYEKYAIITNVPYMYPGTASYLVFPDLSNNGLSGHLEVSGRISTKFFTQQLIWFKYTDRVKLYAVRTLIEDGNNFKVIRIYNPSNINVNWSDFSIPNNVFLAN